MESIVLNSASPIVDTKAAPALRLGEARLRELPAPVGRPGYARKEVRPGILHLGIGAFHRAHQAVVIEDCLEDGQRDWGIVAASLRSPATRDALAPQDGLYTVVEDDGVSRGVRVIGSVLRIIVAPEDPEALIRALADPQTRIVSLTVTEKGYLRGADGNLDLSHPDLVHDLGSPERPRSLFGFLATALARRRASDASPLAILCCDNLPANGRLVRKLLGQFLGAGDPDLAAYAENRVGFPSSVVDRIVPATTKSEREAISGMLGVEDAWPLRTEPYLSWIIEDDFPGGRPDFVTNGVRLVGDVAPYEAMKLRLLNGAHSAIALSGLLCGRETVAEAIADPAIRRLVGAIWREAGATLEAPAEERQAFTEALLARFSNRALFHRLAQIATDSSQKLPQRLLAPARTLYAQGRAAPGIVLALAAWLETLHRLETGAGFDYADPERKRLCAIVGADPGGEGATSEALDVLGLARDEPGARLRADVAAAWRLLHEEGFEAQAAALAGNG